MPHRASQVAPVVKNLPTNAGDVRDARDMGSVPGWGDPLEKEMAAYSIFLPGEAHGQRSLEGYSPWSHRESDATE